MYTALSHISPRAYPRLHPVDVPSQLVWNLPIPLLGCYKNFTPGTLAFFKPLFSVPSSMQQRIFLLNSNITSLLSKLSVTPCDFWNTTQCLITSWLSPLTPPHSHPWTTALSAGPLNMACPPHVSWGFHPYCSLCPTCFSLYFACTLGDSRSASRLSSADKPWVCT